MVEKRTDRDIYAEGIGRILGNLQSLEFAIRLFLLERQSKGKPIYPYRPDAINKDDIIEENALTNYDTLGDLITKFNDEIKRLNVRPESVLDARTVKLRDALVHGRAVTKTAGFPIYLVKFSQAQNGKVKVVYKEEVTHNWLDRQIKLVLQEINKVRNTAQTLGMKSFPAD